MKPFDDYPGNGRKFFSRLKHANCRHEDGLELQRKTRQRRCAYCGVSLVDTYEHWLMMSLDHVVPTSVARSLGIPEEWFDDFANTVLCCSACNGFANRYEVPASVSLPESESDFFALRDKIFKERRAMIRACHGEERAFFESKPWEQETKLAQE